MFYKGQYVSATIESTFVYNSKAGFNLFLTWLDQFMIYSVKGRDNYDISLEQSKANI